MASNLSQFDQIVKNTFHLFPRNESYATPGWYDLPVEDATFPILICLIIFQMRTGLGLLEAGIAQRKNGVNIMMKNIADVCIGGLAYYIFGYALAFGRGELTNPFFAVGDFLVDTKFGDPLTCQVFTLFLYQMSYAVITNTIVSGAIAERARFSSYCILTFPMTILYSIASGWMWGEHGWLRNLGAVDLSGGMIHIVGGAAGLACTMFIGPRIGRYEKGTDPLPMGNAMNSLVGLFILWWNWVAFNVGGTYGLTGGKWHYAVRAGVNTALSSWGAGTAGILFSMYRHKGKVDVLEVISGVLSALIMITSSSYVMPTWLAVLTGCLSAILSISLIPFLDKFRIDDPIGVLSVHWVGGVWGYLTVGLFAVDPVPLTVLSGKVGLFMGGSPYFLFLQLIAILALTLLGFFGVLPIIWITDKIIPLRLTPEEEEKGCDIVEHDINEVPEIPAYLGDIDNVRLQNVKFDDQNQLSITMSVNPNNLTGNERIFQDSLRQRSNGIPNGTHVRHVFNTHNDLQQIHL